MPPANYNILMVDDEEHMIATMEFILGNQYELRSAQSIAAARTQIQARCPDLLLLDLGLPDEPGTVLLEEIRKAELDVDVIVITAVREVGTAVKVMQLGALDYITKPFEKEDILLCVRRAYENWSLRREAERLRSELYAPFYVRGIVAESPVMKGVLDIAKKMAHSEATVLITGESGTGKELVARAIHCEGDRSRGPFVAVNCAQFSGSLLESELFGHEKGAFTGATQLRKGRFELADGGTLFLDEVGNTSMEMQAKILRVVESKEFERVGGQESIKSNVRLLAATNADLETEMREGRFREDLYYRLNVVRIEIPPLKERPEDIPALCEHFLEKYRAKTGRDIRGITPEAMSVMKAYGWRGNVRELQNVIEMAIALEDEKYITTRYLPAHIISSATRAEGPSEEGKNILETVVQNFERRFLAEQLRLNEWAQAETARRLRIHRNTLENKMKRYGLRKPG